MADTLIGLLQQQLDERPKHVWLEFQGRTQGYADLWDGLSRCASFLLDQGLEPGARVLISLHNGPEFFTSFYGVQRAGGIPVPVEPSYGPGRLAAVARHAGAVFHISDQTAEGVFSPQAWSDHPRRDEFPRLEADDVAFIQYTSGSTGDPKGVLLSHRKLLANLRQLGDALRASRDDVFVSWLPLSHDMGLILMSMLPMSLAARLVLLPVSLTRAGVWLQTIQDQRGSFTAAPDFAYRYCLRYVKNTERFDLSSLRVALNAAEPIRVSTARAFEKTFGLKRVMVSGYGLAEASVGVSTGVPGEPLRADADGCVCVGRPLRDMQVRIEDGEILIRGPSVTAGYFLNPTASAALQAGEGFIRTGDLGYLDEQGRLYVTGRRKDIIIQSGRNIAPREVEELIDQADFVRRSAALGIDKGGEEGEQVYLFAEIGRGEIKPAELAAELVRRFHAHFGFRPGRVFLLASHGIPRTPNGKLMRERLRQDYLDGELARQGLIRS